MTDNILFICPTCGNSVSEFYVKTYPSNYAVCYHCNSEWYNTGLTENQWKRMLMDTGATNPGGKEIKQFAISYLTDRGILHIDTSQQEARELQSQRLKEQFHSKPRCPKCGSTNLGKTKRGFSTGKAVAAGMLTGFLDVAAVAGAAGSNKMINCCNECGHTWK